jgi:hypothetical protein
MDSTSLIVSFVFGMAGMGFLMYGKSSGSLVPVAAGVLLMVCPYFIPNVIVMLIVCTALMIAPFLLRNA